MKSGWQLYTAAVAISLGVFIVSLEWSMVQIALPSIQRDLHITVSQLQWVMNAFSLAMIPCFVTMGKLADQFGRRRVFLIGIFFFALGELGASVAPNIGWLIAFRTLQGATTAICLPVSQGLLTHLFPPSLHGRSLGIWSTTIGLGLALGSFVSGFIIEFFGWRWVFIFSIPFALISFAWVFFQVPESKDPQKEAKIDGLGVGTLTLALLFLVIAVIHGPDWGWLAGITLTAIGISLLFWCLFFYVEGRVSQPILPLRLFAHPQFCGAAMSNFCMVAYSWAIFFFWPVYLHNIVHLSIWKIGVIMLFYAVPFSVMSGLTGLFIDRTRPKLVILFGMACMSLAAFWEYRGVGLTILMVNLLLPLAISGFGWGVAFGPATSSGILAIPKRLAATAAGALNTIQEIGGSIGLAVAVALFRAFDAITLNTELLKIRQPLEEGEKAFVQTILSDPVGAINHIASSVDAERAGRVLNLFHLSFVKGFHATLLYLCALMAVGFLVVLFLLPWKKASSDLS